MSADNEIRVNVVLSDTDKSDGLVYSASNSVGIYNSGISLTDVLEELEIIAYSGSNAVGNEVFNADFADTNSSGLVNEDGDTAATLVSNYSEAPKLVTFTLYRGAIEVATGVLYRAAGYSDDYVDYDSDDYVINFVDATSGTSNGYNTSWEYYSVTLDTTATYTLTISYFVDSKTAGEIVDAGSTDGDGIDDRTQVGYELYVETGINTGVYETATGTSEVSVLWANANDDIVADVMDGTITTLPYWTTPRYDSEYNEYWLAYEVDYENYTIYAHWVEATEATITAVNENTSSSTETEEGETEGSTESGTGADVETGSEVTVPDTSSK